MAEEKIYCGTGKEVNFDNGGSIIRVSFSPADLEKINLSARSNKGWANINVSKRREVSDKGLTHYVTLNTWRPRQEVQSFDSQSDLPASQIPNVYDKGLNPVKKYVLNQERDAKSYDAEVTF